MVHRGQPLASLGLRALSSTTTTTNALSLLLYFQSGSFVGHSKSNKSKALPSFLLTMWSEEYQPPIVKQKEQADSVMSIGLDHELFVDIRLLQ